MGNAKHVSGEEADDKSLYLPFNSSKKIVLFFVLKIVLKMGEEED